MVVSTEQTGLSIAYFFTLFFLPALHSLFFRFPLRAFLQGAPERSCGGPLPLLTNPCQATLGHDPRMFHVFTILGQCSNSDTSEVSWEVQVVEAAGGHLPAFREAASVLATCI